MDSSYSYLIRGTALAVAALASISFHLAVGAEVSPPDKMPAPLFEDIGRHHHPVTTRSALAQRYFDQGMMLLFNFNHKEAIRSFRAAASLDPQCAMAYWGEACLWAAYQQPNGR